MSEIVCHFVVFLCVVLAKATTVAKVEHSALANQLLSNP